MATAHLPQADIGDAVTLGHHSRRFCPEFAIELFSRHRGLLSHPRSPCRAGHSLGPPARIDCSPAAAQGDLDKNLTNCARNRPSRPHPARKVPAENPKKTEKIGHRRPRGFRLWTTLSGFKSLPPSQINPFHNKHLRHLAIADHRLVREPRYRASSSNPASRLVFIAFADPSANSQRADETRMRQSVRGGTGRRVLAKSQCTQPLGKPGALGVESDIHDGVDVLGRSYAACGRVRQEETGRSFRRTHRAGGL